MATKKKRCTKGVVKSGPRKGKCRKVCPKNCKTLGKARRAAPKRKASRRRRARTAAGASSIFGPYADGYRLPAGAGPWRDAYVGARAEEDSGDRHRSGMNGWR